MTDLSVKDALQLAADAEQRNGEMAARIVELCDTITGLRISLSEGNKWIPASERRPAENTYVLVWYRASYPGWRVSIGEVSCGHWRPEGGNGNFDDDITHWMPLPEAPK